MKQVVNYHRGTWGPVVEEFTVVTARVYCSQGYCYELTSNYCVPKKGNKKKILIFPVFNNLQGHWGINV